MRRVLIAAQPFGRVDPTPRELLEAGPAELRWNPHPRKLTRDELLELLEGCCAVVASTEPYDAGVLDAHPQLRLIARTGVGLDSVDLEAARARGVAVTTTPDAPADSVAELTVGLLVSLARQVVRADREMRGGVWNRRTGWLLRARTVGIIGLGRIGQRVARLLRPFGCRLLAFDIDPGVKPAAEELGVTMLPLSDLCEQADALTFHVPLTPKTRGMCGVEILSVTRPGVLILNTARGPVVNEEVLLAALEAGRVGGAALDVFGEEPYSGPLLAREDVIVTAHMGSCSDEGRKAMELGAAQAVRAFLADEPLTGRVV